MGKNHHMRIITNRKEIEQVETEVEPNYGKDWKS